jgi:diacylglycerol kinase
MALKGKKYKTKNLFESFKYATIGIITGFKKTRNLWVDSVFFVAVIVLGFVFNVSILEWIALLLCCSLVISLELVNTAIEEAVNLASPEIHPLAKISKDVAAGAVLISALFSVVIGMLIFIPKIF